MKVACVGYRDWALKIYDCLREATEHKFLIFRSKREYDKNKLVEFNPDIVLFYGWSWIVGQEIIDKFNCVMLHPSPLPKYRGGSPLQNQIINGETDGAVTLFIMDNGVDTGDIIAQEYMSLTGHMSKIFERIYEIGSRLTLKILENGYERNKQEHSQATYFPRRKKKESEITLKEIQTMDGEYLYNKIRMLEDPYPNSFIRTKDGRKLFIKSAELE